MDIRRTRQRDVVLEAVRSTMDHPRAEWVYRQARRRLPRIGLGTVYRNLKRLAEQGLIREIHAGGHPARFDGNTGRHYHIRCLACGRVNDLPMTVDTRLEERAARAVNYQILGHQVEILGLCPLCRREPVKNDSQDNENASFAFSAAEPLVRSPRRDSFPARRLIAKKGGARTQSAFSAAEPLVRSPRRDSFPARRLIPKKGGARTQSKEAR